jgi:PAS domain S-box-containing protein
MQGSFSEIYVADSSTLHFIQTNQAARKNLRYSAAELAAMTPLDLAPSLSRDALARILQPLRNGRTSRAEFDTTHRRKDGTTYPIEFRLFCCPGESGPVFVAIGNDTTPTRCCKARRVCGQSFPMRRAWFTSSCKGPTAAYRSPI